MTELHVTFGGIMAPSRFHRVTTTSHQSADVNKGKGVAAYLWCKRGQGDPVTSVSVLYDDEETPEGFKKLPKDLSRGRHVYISFQRQPETDSARGISELVILYSDEDVPGEWMTRLLATPRVGCVALLTVLLLLCSYPEGEGWERVPRSLNREESVWLWLRRAGDGGTLKLSNSTTHVVPLLVVWRFRGS